MANMFGALNRFISRLDSDPNNIPTQSSSGQQHRPGTTTGHGFQVLRNTDSTLALEPWFDYIIGINGRTLDTSDPTLFSTEVRNCAGGSVSLGVFSAKGSQIREQYLSVPADASTLGLTLQWTPLAAVEDVWHILDVMPTSPADVAGLLPYSDYVIGSPDIAQLRGEASFSDLVEQYTARPLRLHVYNAEYDVTRLLTLTPSKEWGGTGALGCVLGYGALHRVPAPLTEPADQPGEMMFDTATNPSAADPYLVPANMASPPPQTTKSPAPAGALGTIATPPPPPTMLPLGSAPPPSGPPSGPPTSGPPSGPPGGRAKKPRPHAAPIGGLDDYFAEGEQKSRELEGTPPPSKNASSLPPPPPKAGEKGAVGPPKARSPAVGA